MPDKQSADMSPLVSREQAGNEIGKALRLYVGRGRRYSVKQLSNATGVKDRVIECAITDPASVDYRPLSLEALLSITKFLGADFTCEWLGLADQGAFDLPDEETPPAMRMAIDSTTDSTKLLHIAADDLIDRDESTEAAAIGRRKISQGMTLVAAARKAA